MNSTAVSNNQLFVGGIGLYGIAIGAFALRHLGRHLFGYLQRSCLVSLETSSRDVSYKWIMQWISAEGIVKSRQLSILNANTEILANDSITTKSMFLPAPNVTHFFYHNKRLFWLKRNRQSERSMVADVSQNDIPESLTITAIGRDTAPLLDIFRTARDHVAQQEHEKTVLYNCAGARWVRLVEPRRTRSLASVVLHRNLMENIVKDLNTFISSDEWYHKMGIPYRRGYLLYGPPGCGKSSLVMAIAGRFSLAICMINLSNRSLDDDSLNQLLNSAPKKCAILLEDIDLAFHPESRITISGLLNALDGVTAQEGRMVFMTTNHIEKLSDALIRPGRVDVRMFLGYADREQMKLMFARFFPNDPAEADSFSDTLIEAQGKGDGTQISIAEIQGFLFHHRESAHEAQRAAKSYFSQNT
ncbi:ATP-dependent chaperone [Perkinsela sp. CCAP 1560/4]|nr:ATP-dependent chaperone [Perkinsela sp. CCAP 1560/4]|eukprot:KNH05171.1 ATP-dependent chaperone [Perkinsela sp. CCAP 1560/4]